MNVFWLFAFLRHKMKHVFCSCLVWGFMKTLIWLVHVTIVFLYSTNTVDASGIWIMRISHDFSCDFLTIRWWLPYFWTITRNHQLRCPRRTPCALAEALELSTSKLEINAPRQAERPFTPAGVPRLHFFKGRLEASGNRRTPKRRNFLQGGPPTSYKWSYNPYR